MTDSIEIRPSGPLRRSIRPPGSKSITNRALVCAALAEGTSTLEGALASDDTRVMIDCLGRMGIEVRADSTGTSLAVTGCGGRPPASGGELFVGNSGTTIRFLTAAVALGRGTFRLYGVPRMHERPIEDLLAALRQFGVDARSERGDGCPPVIVRAGGLGGGSILVRGDISSQYLSGLLLAAPAASGPVEIRLEGLLVSQPYVRMTLAVMDAFGANVEADAALSVFRIPAGQSYRACRYSIEPDASAASYFFAAAAITGGEVTVEGLSRASLQGDVAFSEVLASMGCRVTAGENHLTVAGGRLRGIDVNMNQISDTVQTLAAVALFAEGPTTIRGVAHIRHKETDRLAALAAELRKLGAGVEELADGLRITPGALRGAEIDTYDDHRMAMSLALVGLAVPGVVIRNPQCTSKTYPRFFDDLKRLAG